MPFVIVKRGGAADVGGAAGSASAVVVAEGVGAADGGAASTALAAPAGAATALGAGSRLLVLIAGTLVAAHAAKASARSDPDVATMRVLRWNPRPDDTLPRPAS